MSKKTRPQTLRGFRDFYPEDWEFQKWLSNEWLSLGRLFGYQEYEGPILEGINLYLGKSSAEIIKEQTFTLTDRDNKKLLLRPELTPTLARMIAQKENELTFPVRWQSYGRFFRYEKPQRGRARSFFQWNIDILGTESVVADAEIITIACLALKKLGITPKEARIKINDRQLLEQLLISRLNISPKLSRPIFRIIDKLDKIGPSKFEQALKKQGLSNSQAKNLFAVLKKSNPSLSPWLKDLLSLLKTNGVTDYVELDLTIVRAFEYYTRTVFEAWATTSLKRALFGGGRYDNLTLQVGGKKRVPGVGFAIGDMPIAELLKELGKYPPLRSNKSKVLVTVFSPEYLEKSIEVTRSLRRNRVNTELYLDPEAKLDKQLKYADRKEIPFVIIIGPEEVKENAIALRDMKAKSQRRLSLKQLLALPTLEGG